MGLWYSKDSCIVLTAFADADHVGCQDISRSTSSSMQVLGDRLTMALDSTKYLCTAITRVLLLYVVTMSNTRDPSILTLDTISSRRKWKMVWLSYTSSKQNISGEIYVPRHWDEKDLNFINKLGMRSMSLETLKRLAEELEE
ncbi:hypothetical protein Tco_1042134 [Tanacetum coccineum]|uniref:Uncharacterized protein n=1 Tax=Tanacetum coccineum TaxID=301880 RepID=A0ABQ5GJP4_9ASTR